MGIWNAATPTGSDNAREGDDRIREAKTAIEEALSADGTFPGASPSLTPIFIPGFPRGATGSRPTGDRLVSGRFYVNTTLNVLERYNGATWDSVGTVIPSGTKMLFYQAAAPVGWTAVALNDKFLRVVTAAGTGGSSGGSGLTPSATLTLAHTHTVASHTHTLGNHTHSTPDHQHDLEYVLSNDANSDGGSSNVVSTGVSGADIKTRGGTNLANVRNLKNRTENSGAGTSGVPSSNTSGANAPATDSQLTTTAFQYADVIVATKD